jgi:tetratricopeptide (TPR) repeat protein
MKCLCVPDPDSQTGTEVDHVCLFRNDPALRWTYRVHEQILPAIRQSGGEVRWSDVVIRHTGYLDAALRRRKLERDLRLLQLENAEQPDEPFVLFNLGSIANELGQAHEALRYFQRSLELSHPSDSIVRKLYALIAQCQRQLGHRDEALTSCLAGRHYYPDDAELLFLEALVRQEQRDLLGAVACLERLIAGQEGEHFGSVATGLRGYRARHLLALLWREMGRLADAENEARNALAERLDYTPAWLELGEVYLAQERWPELDEVVVRLEGDRQSWLEAAVLQARGQLARKEFAAARGLLEAAIAKAPQAL